MILCLVLKLQFLPPVTVNIRLRVWV